MVIKRNVRTAILATTLTLSAVAVPIHTSAATDNSAIELYGSDIYNSYSQQIERDSIKYGLIENRNKTFESNELAFTYYTHYSLNQSSALKNAKFNFTIDEDLIPYTESVLVRTTKGKWVSLNKLNDATYAINHKDVLSTSLIGVNQQFDIKVVLKDTINQLDQDKYKFDIALINRNQAAIKSTMDATLLQTQADYTNISRSNNVTASGITVKSNNPSQNQIVLNYMMHYKLNNLSNKNGLFKFEMNEKLIPYVKDVQVQTNDGTYKSVALDSSGRFSYAAHSLVSHAKIGVRQNFDVKIILNDQIKNLPEGLYDFSAYQTDGNGTLILENTDNSTYFMR